MMKKPFDDNHAGIESQIWNLPADVPDSKAVRAAKAQGDTVEGLLALGKALSGQLRYREAIQAYTDALVLQPDHPAILRLRAGRYLSTLQSDLAIQDFEKCLSLGAEKLDCLYRIGLAHYYAGRYGKAAEVFKSCMPLCDDEMGIAVIYWHTLSSYREETKLFLLDSYHTGMEVGHHFAYEKAMQVWTGNTSLSGMLGNLEQENDDLEYCITLYGLLYYPECGQKEELFADLLRRDGFWPSFAYLAAWNDRVGMLHS